MKFPSILRPQKQDKTKSRDREAKLVEVMLPADSLEIGMYVTRLDRPWTEVPVMFQGLTLNSPDDIEMLQKHCEFVYIEIEEEFWLEHKLKTAQKSAKTTTYPGLIENKPFRDEMPRAKSVFEDTRDYMGDVLEKVSQDQTIDIDASRTLIKRCVDSILTNPNALLWLSKLKNEDHYTAEHCMRVGILAIAFGRFLGLERQELELLGLCGMLHDVGKMKVPKDILNKPGRLSRLEFDIMRQHTTFGKEILSQHKNLEPMVIEAAYSHHERIDGKGYPDGALGGYLHKYVRMITIVDAYDAITSSRVYKEGSPAFDALKILFAERDKHFDNDLVEAFIRMVGIYPPGTLVELNTGDVGIVVSANPNARLRPKVELVLDRSKQRRQPYIINLADNIQDDHGITYAIQTGLANGTYGVDVKDYVNIAKAAQKAAQ